MVWSQQLPAPVFGTPAVAGPEVLLVPCANGSLYGLDLDGGAVLWTVATGAPLFSSPLVLWRVAAGVWPAVVSATIRG